MFEKSTIKAYRQVTAPVGLKERVMESYETKPANVGNIRLYKNLSVMAACLVLILSGTAFVNRNNVSILFNGEPLTEQPTVVSDGGTIAPEGVAMASLERSTPMGLCIPLEVAASEGSMMAISAGEMQIFASDTGELLFTGTEYTASDVVLVKWYLEGGQDANMRITSGKKECFVQVEYDEADDLWEIHQE